MNSRTSLSGWRLTAPIELSQSAAITLVNTFPLYVYQSVTKLWLARSGRELQDGVAVADAIDVAWDHGVEPAIDVRIRARNGRGD